MTQQRIPQVLYFFAYSTVKRSNVDFSS